jgi:hypothetical protein
LPDEESLLLIIDFGIDAAASVEQVRLFKERYPAGRTAVLADRYQRDDGLLSDRVGANAYLVKIFACDVLLKSLERVMLGETILPAAVLPSISGPEGLHDAEASENPGGSAHPGEDKIVDEPIGCQGWFRPATVWTGAAAECGPDIGPQVCSLLSVEPTSPLLHSATPGSGAHSIKPAGVSSRAIFYRHP